MTQNMREIFDSSEIAAAVSGMTDAIIAGCALQEDCGVALVGLYRQGVPLAMRLADEIFKRTGCRIKTGKLDISMYRDDFGMRSGLPLIQETVIPFEMDGCRVILVDDVLSSGRTIRAALDALTDYGRPAGIRLAVLIDRGEPEYPIHADYIGRKLVIPPSEKVVVRLRENDGIDSVSTVNWQKQ